jgi:hypothetical protein
MNGFNVQHAAVFARSRACHAVPSTFESELTFRCFSRHCALRADAVGSRVDALLQGCRRAALVKARSVTGHGFSCEAIETSLRRLHAQQFAWAMLCTETSSPTQIERVKH